MKKEVLKKELRKLTIPVVGGKFVKREDIKKSLGIVIAPMVLQQIERAYKVNENNDWTVFKLPCEEDAVKGVPTFDAFHFLCDGTSWTVTDDFWNQLKQAQKVLYVFISKNKPQGDPQWKLACDDSESLYLDATDNVVANVGNLKLPSIAAQAAPQVVEDKCTCDIYELMRNGCNCGAVQRMKEKGQYSFKDTHSHLKAELKKLGVRVKGNLVHKKDLKKLLTAEATKTIYVVCSRDYHSLEIAFTKKEDAKKFANESKHGMDIVSVELATGSYFKED